MEIKNKRSFLFVENCEQERLLLDEWTSRCWKPFFTEAIVLLKLPFQKGKVMQNHGFFTEKYLLS